jgi:hypothetical protein
MTDQQPTEGHVDAIRCNTPNCPWMPVTRITFTEDGQHVFACTHHKDDAILMAGGVGNLSLTKRYADGSWSGSADHRGTPAADEPTEVADAEQADLRAELEKYKRGARELGRIIDQQCRMVLDATGLHDRVNEDGDGDWGAIWDNLFELLPRAEKAEQQCRDLCQSDGDVRARLADAENALAQVTPDAHLLETLRLRTAAMHRVIGSNDQLRRENDDLRARLIDAEDLIQQLRQAQ